MPYLSAAFGVIYVLVKPSVSIYHCINFIPPIFVQSYAKDFNVFFCPSIQFNANFTHYLCILQTYAVISKASNSVNQVSLHFTTNTLC